MGWKIKVVGGRRAGAEIALEGREFYVVGSAPDAHVQIPDDGVRPDHVRLFAEDGGLVLMDPTGDGVPVNGQVRAQADLQAGDEITVGPVALRIAGAPSVAGVLVVQKGPDEGKRLRVERRVTLGRGTTADIPLLDMKCSREHCAVERHDDGYYVVDLGSTNGTRWNDQKLEGKVPQKLRTGDKIRLGGTVLEFRGPAEPAPATSPAPAPAPAAPAPNPTASGRLRAVAPAPALPPSATPAPAPKPAPAVTFSSGKAFEIDLDDLDAPATPVPADDAARRGAVTQAVRPGGVWKKPPGPGTPALSGDLESTGFREIVESLHQQQRSGELVLRATSGEHRLAFVSGNVVDAWGPRSAPDAVHAFHAIARLRRGRYEFQEGTPARPVRIQQPTLALLTEAVRLADEATDPGD